MQFQGSKLFSSLVRIPAFQSQYVLPSLHLSTMKYAIYSVVLTIILCSIPASSRRLVLQDSGEQSGSSGLQTPSAGTAEPLPGHRRLHQANTPPDAASGGGDGSSTGTLPKPVTTFYISAGNAHTCALNADGAVWCFGSNEKGQLGNGTIGGSSADPVQVDSETRFKLLMAGGDHTCGLAMDDTAWCWGDNTYGQIGSGNTSTNAIPQPTPVAGGGEWSSLSSGSAHSCGTHVDGSGWCWGQGSTGQIGDGTTTPVAAAPVRVAASDVASSVSSSQRDVWAQIEAGNGYSCGLRSDGKLACWGSFQGGQLGFSLTDTSSTQLSAVTISNTSRNDNTMVQTKPRVLTILESSSVWKEVGTGLGHVTCAISDKAEAYCWGEPQVQLGNSESTGATGALLSDATLADQANAFADFLGDTSYSPSPSPTSSSSSLIPVGGGVTWKSISAGGSSTCGIAFGGQAMCFGNNSVGQLGTGSSVPYQYEPTEVSISGAKSGGGDSSVTWEQISVGAEHACAVQYVSATGKRNYLCWGQGASGQLGTGTFAESSRPANVLDLKPKVQTTTNSPSTDPQTGIDSPPVVVASGGTNNNQTSSSETGGSSVSIGVIIGAVIGGIVVIACIVAAFMVHRRRKLRRQEVEDMPGFAKRLSAEEIYEYTSIAKLKGVDDGDEERPATLPSEYLTSGSLPSDSISINSLAKATLGEEEEDPVLSWVLQQSMSAMPLKKETSLKSRTSGSSSSELPAHVQPWEFTWDEVTLIKELARGSYGRVYLCRKSEATVAIKLFVYCESSPLAAAKSQSDTVQSSGPIATVIPQHLAEEASILASLRHPHIVNFLGFCLTPPAIAFEYCARGSVYDVLRAAAADKVLARELTWTRRVNMAIDAATGMLHLHSRTPSIVHCDLKTPNLMVAKDWVVKVGDFNLSKLQNEAPLSSDPGSNGSPGNPRWLAPEVLEGKKATPASDVYSFGIILWELLTWSVPWSTTNQYMVRKEII